LGNFFNGWLIDRSTVIEDAAKVVNWQPLWNTNTAISAVLVLMLAVLFRDPLAARGAELDKEANR
jgi:hypothetical protein